MLRWTNMGYVLKKKHDFIIFHIKMILLQWNTGKLQCRNIMKHICLLGVKDRGSSHSVQLMQRLFTEVSKWPRYGLIAEKQIDSQACECKLHGNRRWLCHFNSEGHTFHFIELGRVTRASLRHRCPGYYIMRPSGTESIWTCIKLHWMLCRSSVFSLYLMLKTWCTGCSVGQEVRNGQVVTLV